jgi:hypothetical protein
MDEMGLDADDALQYAMMLSMEDASASASSTTSPRAEDGYAEDWGDGDVVAYGDEGDEVDEAIRAVEEFKRAEEEEIRRAMEAIQLAEGR